MRFAPLSGSETSNVATSRPKSGAVAERFETVGAVTSSRVVAFAVYPDGFGLPTRSVTLVRTSTVPSGNPVRSSPSVAFPATGPV